MTQWLDRMTRRTFLLRAAAMGAAFTLIPGGRPRAAGAPIRRPIPSSGEELPVIGMGTWQTFDVGEDPAVRAALAEVLQAFFEQGGKVIDSSPMYGRAEAVLGDLLKRTPGRSAVFAATKVWTNGRRSGIEQMRRSMQRMGLDMLDLMQIHNLRDWRTHLPVLRQWKEQGLLRYIGITTSHGLAHDEMERIMRKEPLDFVQFTYNLIDRQAEDGLLPLAAERGLATLINRPFAGAELFSRVKGEPLPSWSAEFDCTSWSQFFLKFIAAHPAVTCVIPATSKLQHMRDNMQAGFGRLPDAAMRRRMLAHYASI